MRDRRSILVVDDDDIVAQTIERTLRRSQFDTCVAHSGVEALKFARRHTLDLVILDIIMPGMDGFQVCREMRIDPRLSHLPILFLTAKTKESDIIEGFTAGADDYLTKPFSIDELILRVNAILRRSGRRQEEESTADLRLLQVGEATLDCQTFQIHLPHGTYSLTPVQYDLLYHLMLHAGEVFSAHRLLNDVWDYPYDAGSPDLVRVHIRNLRQRIEQNPHSPKYVKTVIGHGYTFGAQEEE